MSRTESMLEELAGITGSLGPMGSWEARLDQVERWQNGLGPSDIPALRDVLMMPASELDAKRLDPEEVYITVSEGLRRVGPAAEEAVMAVFEAALGLEHLTDAVLDAMGNWGSTRVGEFLGRWMAGRELNERVAVSLAGALGSVGGDGAMGLLEELEARYPGYEELQEEIAIARANAHL